MRRQRYSSRLSKCQRHALLSFIFLFFLNKAYAQPCTISSPVLFGTPVDKIVCRGNDAQLGVNASEETQQYFFYVNNGAPRNIGGPLVGNGGQLSVDASIVSAASIGQYYVETVQGSCSVTNPGFYVYYGNIDDLSITAWGGDSVSFSWASSGRSPYVKYEYAVTTESDPYNIPDADTATTYNTSATVTGLAPTTTYYIHVRVFEVYKQPYGGVDGAQVDDQCFSGIPWATIYFTSCSGSPAIGGITVSNPFFCTGNTTTLTATGGLTYQWYRDGSIINTQGTNPDYFAGTQGDYSVYITSNAGCEGMAYSKYIIERKTVPGVFSGGGDFCTGDEVKLGISKTDINQVYEIRNNGQLVATLQGIGKGFQSEDTIWYSFNINSPSQAGNYTVTTYNAPCNGITFGNLSINLLAIGNINPSAASICGSGSILLTANGGTTYEWFKDGIPVGGPGATYTATAPGEYSVIIHEGGCNNLASNTCIVTTTAPLTSTTNIAICANQLPYLWNGIPCSTGGSYTFTTTGSNGCDSIATLNLTENPIATSTTNIAICPAQLPYIWNSVTCNSAGIYNTTLTASNGCDSIATLNLSVNNVVTSTTNASTCANQLPYVWNGNNYTATGTYNVTLTGSNGCDSIATLNLTVKPILTSTTTVSVCENQLPYVWNGNNYVTSGTYNVMLTGSNGCDSIATLNLTIEQVLMSITTASVCENQLPYVWNGNNYTSTGTYNVMLTGSNGCDSIATLNLTVKPILTSTTTVSVCQNQLPYVWNGNNYNTTGIYNIIFNGSDNCDSVATLNLTVNPTTTSTTNTSVCSNQLPIIWNGISCSTEGTYTFATTGSNGCDSIAILALTIKSPPFGTVNPSTSSICAGNSQTFTTNGGVIYQWYLNNTAIVGATSPTYVAMMPGIYTATITGANGCSGEASNSGALQVLQKPVADFSYDLLCQNEQTTFGNSTQFTNSGTVQWKWDFGDNTSATSLSVSHIYSQPGDFSVTLIAIPDECPQLADTIKKNLTITAAIDGIKYPDERVLRNIPSALSARNIGQQYSWQPVLGLNDPAIQTPMVTATADKLYTIHITTNAGCLVVDTLLVRVFDKTEVFVPKGFTPNGNNTNDILKPLCVGVASIDYFRVFNRWGEMVYQTKTVGEGWNGIFKNVLQPTDTYTWIFAGKTFDGTIIKTSGKTVLIR